MMASYNNVLYICKVFYLNFYELFKFFQLKLALYKKNLYLSGI